MDSTSDASDMGGFVTSTYSISLTVLCLLASQSKKKRKLSEDETSSSPPSPEHVESGSLFLYAVSCVLMCYYCV